MLDASDLAKKSMKNQGCLCLHAITKIMNVYL